MSRDGHDGIGQERDGQGKPMAWSSSKISKNVRNWNTIICLNFNANQLHKRFEKGIANQKRSLA
ncbi:hypothetical protein BC937DRAFT_87748 [Endogone sp. FLAS-F59071]|nr:hypothetical protein BC937DRAFT_87748 [Endogone sp. FLAS-F59071]|eukprot:RUS19267.1 hypothetical protein BC937DRAFT_87748 [Endogone sp. FLAS-F59071]